MAAKVSSPRIKLIILRITASLLFCNEIIKITIVGRQQTLIIALSKIMGGLV